MPTHSSSSSSPPEGVLRAALALVHARLDPKLALAVLIVFCFRRVLYTLVPIRPRPRGERRSLRTLPGASLRPPLAGFNPDTPRRLSTPTDAFQLHPDVRSYGTTLSVGARKASGMLSHPGSVYVGRLEVRSISSHWSPYDRVRVVNADP